MQIFKKIIPFYEFDALCNADLEYVKEQRFKNRLKYNATKLNSSILTNIYININMQ